MIFRNDYKNPLLSADEKRAMLRWLTLGNIMLTHRAKFENMMPNTQLFTFRTVCTKYIYYI